MISGQARKGLSEIGLNYHAAIPTIIVGKEHEITHVADGPILAIPFETDYGPLTVEVCFGPLSIQQDQEDG